MEAAFIVLVIFAAITVWVVAPLYFFRKKGNVTESAVDEERIARLESERDYYRERLRHLEAFVCDVDRELNTKLNRFASLGLSTPSGVASEGGEPSNDIGHSATQLSPSLPPPASLAPGARLAERFVIVRSIGAGSMGEVFEARDDKLGETVALKVMSGLALLEPEATQRFQREAVAARRITHPNVVRLHDIGEDGNLSFISMELVRGASLADRLRREGTLGLAEARELASQVCDALEAAHGTGVIHRDLKPHNILIDEENRYRVIDFGVAQLPYLEGMTATGMILGTPEYMAPEQIRGRPVDVRSDIYALGAILFHALSGRPPYRGDSAIAVGFAHCNDPVPSLTKIRPEIDDEWERFVHRALQKEPSQRFDTAVAMREAIPAG
jgi:serine/threonine-protein kinase